MGWSVPGSSCIGWVESGIRLPPRLAVHPADGATLSLQLRHEVGFRAYSSAKLSGAQAARDIVDSAGATTDW
jgi:hypothetical protein